MSESSWETVTALIDPVRRALYEHVRARRCPVTREDAAQAVSISRNLSAFHLDKLVDAGLLRARYEAPADQPRGRGRTPKVYEAVGDGVNLTVPPRHYELAGEILAEAVAGSPTDARNAAIRQAGAVGRQIGAAVAHGDDDVGNATRALADLGYEPRAGGGAIVLENCPFHALARQQTELICGLNHALVTGLLEGLGATLTADLCPHPGGCCVRITA